MLLPLALALAALVQGNSLTHGNAQCPCIDPWARSINLSTHDPQLESSEECRIQRHGDRHCFNAAYGSQGCLSYDLTATPECRYAPYGALPRFCEQRWCFVDPSNCERSPFSTSDYFSEATLGDRPLSRSYATCGFVSAYRLDPPTQIERVLGESKLRIGFPQSYSFGLVTTPPGQGVGGTNRSGAVPLFMDSIFSASEIEWEEVRCSTRRRRPDVQLMAACWRVGAATMKPCSAPCAGAHLASCLGLRRTERILVHCLCVRHGPRESGHVWH